MRKYDKNQKDSNIMFLLNPIRHPLLLHLSPEFLLDQFYQILGGVDVDSTC